MTGIMTMLHAKCYEDLTGRGRVIWKDFTEVVSLDPDLEFSQGARERKRTFPADVFVGADECKNEAHVVFGWREYADVTQLSEGGEGNERWETGEEV